MSYLNGAAIIDAARKCGAKSVHPGYGFLSESASFSEECANASLIFVGPSASAMRSIASKSEAKKLVQRIGVPVLPWITTSAAPNHEMIAKLVGFPLLVKPANGGGGRGMRVVHRKEDLTPAIASSHREATSAFSNTGSKEKKSTELVLERFLPRARHIEVQVFSDGQGGIKHIFDRDCSVQRRFQKVIEECPAPNLDNSLREKLHNAAIHVIRGVEGYKGAGTVEFIVDDDGGQFYFMETNARLQVEHTVTEMVCGEDLVEWQLRVAAGLKLPKSPQLKGCAVQARLYAEDASNNFTPCTGRLSVLKLPQEVEGRVRVDRGVRQGDTVGSHYDPLIAKVVAWGENRADAVHELRRALDNTHVHGVKTNLDFLKNTLEHPSYKSGPVITSFVTSELQNLIKKPSLEPSTLSPAKSRALAIATLHNLLYDHAKLYKHTGEESPWSSLAYFHAGACELPETIPFDWVEGDLNICTVNATCTKPHQKNPEFSIKLPSGDCLLTSGVLSDSGHNLLRVKVYDHILQSRDGISHYDTATNTTIVSVPGDPVFQFRPHTKSPQNTTTTTTGPSLTSTTSTNSASASAVVTPLPGKFVQFTVKKGDVVTPGQTVALIEAMKMEHCVCSHCSGVVEDLALCNPGDALPESFQLLWVKRN
ncbi:Acetyl-/propionyl-coenzyme A carboxylase alpha chain [Pelomyxa schiedti]|nr:Acetyl-/propionyl-coenzyme A carboxylase alpha chain [Pelomyxa schiedti]